jgi:hypothetical protein
MALLAFLCVSENGTIKARDARRITASEIKCVRNTAGCTWADCKKTQRLQRK